MTVAGVAVGVGVADTVAVGVGVTGGVTGGVGVGVPVGGVIGGVTGVDDFTIETPPKINAGNTKTKAMTPTNKDFSFMVGNYNPIILKCQLQVGTNERQVQELRREPLRLNTLVWVCMYALALESAWNEP